MNEVGMIAAFIGGLLSFVSPCVLPLVPIYVSVLSGFSYNELVRASEQKEMSVMLKVVLNAIFFVVGFSLAFIMMGASASLIGQWLSTYRVWIIRIGGILVILFGLYFLGLFRFKWLSMEKQIDYKPKKTNWIGAGVMGFIFALAWTPCVSYVLAGILTMAADTAHVTQGMLLLASYSAGLGIPFLITAIAFAKMLEVFKRMRQWLGVIEKVAGVFLIIIGFLLVTGQFTELTARLARFGSFFGL